MLRLYWAINPIYCSQLSTNQCFLWNTLKCHQEVFILTRIYSKNNNFIFSHSWSNSGSWCTKDYNTGCWAEIYHDYWSGPWTGIPCSVNNKLVQRWTIFRAFWGINWFLMCFYKLYKSSLKLKKKNTGWTWSIRMWYLDILNMQLTRCLIYGAGHLLNYKTELWNISAKCLC